MPLSGILKNRILKDAKCFAPNYFYSLKSYLLV